MDLLAKAMRRVFEETVDRSGDVESPNIPVQPKPSSKPVVQHDSRTSGDRGRERTGMRELLDPVHSHSATRS